MAEKKGSAAGKRSIKSREKNPVPGIDYSEIRIPDEKNLGTGTFTTALEPNAMAKNNPIISSIINEPVFKMLVHINLALEEVIVLLGKADKAPALSKMTFRLPKFFKTSEALRFDAVFKDWKIKQLKMNGKALEKVEE